MREAVRIGELRVDGDRVMWSEERPGEGGRTEIVRWSGDGTRTDLLGPGATHGPGCTSTAAGRGGAMRAWCGSTSWADQRLYRREPSGATRPLTPPPVLERGDRYADGDLSPDGDRIVCIREHHPPGGRGAVDVRNEIVALAAHEPSEPEVLVSGPDFVLAPRWSPDGRHLCWVEWDHPDMPWDGTRLVVRTLGTGEEHQVAGGPHESVSEPVWSPDGTLTFISDRSGWWNLYRWTPADDQVRPLVTMDADIGMAPWQPGLSRYAALADGRIVFAATSDGFDRLFVRLDDGTVHPLELRLLEGDGAAPLCGRLGGDDRGDTCDRAGGPAGRPRPGQPGGVGRRAPEPPRRGDRPGALVGTGADRVPGLRRPDGVRALLPAAEPGVRGTARGAAATGPDDPRRSDGRRLSRSSSRRSSTGRPGASPWST